MLPTSIMSSLVGGLAKRPRIFSAREFTVADEATAAVCCVCTTYSSSIMYTLRDGSAKKLKAKFLPSVLTGPRKFRCLFHPLLTFPQWLQRTGLLFKT